MFERVLNEGMTSEEISHLLKDEINFMGCFMRNERCLPRHGIFILNLDNVENIGTHWTCVFVDKGLYYDSFGMPPPKELNYIKIQSYNIIQHQQITSGLCGLYCIFVIKMINLGLSFYDINYSLLKPNREYKSNYAKLENLLCQMQTNDTHA